MRAVAQRAREDIADLVQRDLVVEQIKAGLGDAHRLVVERGDHPFVAGGLNRAHQRAGFAVDDLINADIAGIGVGQNGEFDHAKRCVDEHFGRCAANAHRGDRRFDLHVASGRNLAGDEDERAFHQVEHHGTVFGVAGVVDQFVQHHAGFGRHGENRFVDEADAKGGVRTG